MGHQVLQMGFYSDYTHAVVQFKHSKPQKVLKFLNKSSYQEGKRGAVRP